MELGFTPGSIPLSSPFSLEYTHSTSQLLSVNILSLSLSSNFLCHRICPSLTVPPSLLLKASEHPFFIFEDLKYNLKKNLKIINIHIIKVSLDLNVYEIHKSYMDTQRFVMLSV